MLAPDGQGVVVATPIDNYNARAAFAHCLQGAQALFKR
jgi:hypothetical protein